MANLRFDDLGTAGSYRDHHRWSVINLRRSDIMGSVEWYGLHSNDGGSYKFIPAEGWAFDADELAEIKEFVVTANAVA